MKPCRQESIYELIEGELSPGDAAGVRQHVKKCVECGRLYSQLRPAAELFKQMPAMDLEAYDALVLRQRALARYGELAEAGLETRQASARMHSNERDFGTLRPARRTPKSRMPLALLSAMSAALVGLGFLCGRLVHLDRSADSTRVTWSVPGLGSEVISAVPEQSSEAASPVSTRVSLQTGSIADEGKLIVVDRILPSGTRVIWNYSNTEGE